MHVKRVELPHFSLCACSIDAATATIADSEL